MPFRSEAQRRFMYANDPKMAARWEKETPRGKLAERVKKRGKKKRVTKRSRKRKASRSASRR